jgi:hypothetical protein
MIVDTDTPTRTPLPECETSEIEK